MQKHVYLFGRFRFDPSQGLLLRDGERIALPRKPFQALELLLQNPGDVVTKDALLQTIWPDSFVEESSLTQCIFLLRKAVGKTGDGAEIVETLPRRGYRIAIPVEIISAQPEPVAAPPAPEPARRTRRWWVIPVASMATLALTLFALDRSGLIWKQPSVTRFTRLTNDGAYKERLISLLSDGTKVYFSEDVDARTYLAEASVDGGETVRHPSPHPIDIAQAYSGTSNEILFSPLWEQSPEHAFTAMSLNGGALRFIGNLSGHAASWSPDGKRIVYIKGLELFIANGDGSNSRSIARMTQPPHWPRWSPDGTRIRFSMQRWTQSVGLWEVNADGSNLHPLFADEKWARQACCGNWTPDGRYFVFVIDEASHSSLWIARDHRDISQSGKARLLASGPVDFWRAPLVSDDGKHLFALGEQARGELVRYDSASHQFLPYLDGLSTDTISFSRDGQWMAWTAYPEGTLWRSRIDGTDRIRLTEPGQIARFPQWSPDGKQLTYLTAGADTLWHIYSISADGGDAKALVPDNSNQGVATWSADGTKILFGQIVTFGVQGKSQQLRILDLNSGAISELPGSSGLWKGRWSPSGKYISAVTSDNRKLMLYDTQRSTWTELANVGVNDCVWSHDGESIYFDSSSDATIFRYTVKTHTLERYASLKGMRRTGFVGWSLNLAPDDSPILLREAGIHEVYSLQLDLP